MALRDEAGAGNLFRLRERLLKDGRRSLFIDHFSGGKHKYEFLKLYLLPDTYTFYRSHNRKTLREAYNIIRSRTAEELKKKLEARDRTVLEDTLLSDFITTLAEEYLQEGKAGYRHLLTSRSNLQKFNPEITMGQIDKTFCRDYTRWLLSGCNSIHGGRLNVMTAHVYSRKLRVILEHAVRMGFMKENPWNLMTRKEKIPEPERMQRFLTREEIEKLEATPYKNPLIKSAFLFACYSGLRISDVLKLQWHEIDYHDKRFFLNLVMKKTGKRLNAPMAERALDHLPYRKGDSNRVFEGLPGESRIQKHLKRFCAEAGVRGRTHFHISRHTFATLMLTAGADIYITSQLLGHSDIRTTQIYAKIVDGRKKEAMDMLEKLLE